jgi:hypothetical protein
MVERSAAELALALGPQRNSQIAEQAGPQVEMLLES